MWLNEVICMGSTNQFGTNTCHYIKKLNMMLNHFHLFWDFPKPLINEYSDKSSECFLWVSIQPPWSSLVLLCMFCDGDVGIRECLCNLCGCDGLTFLVSWSSPVRVLSSCMCYSGLCWVSWDDVPTPAPTLSILWLSHQMSIWVARLLPRICMILNVYKAMHPIWSIWPLCNLVHFSPLAMSVVMHFLMFPDRF